MNRLVRIIAHQKDGKIYIDVMTADGGNSCSFTKELRTSHGAALAIGAVANIFCSGHDQDLEDAIHAVAALELQDAEFQASANGLVGKA